MVSYEIRIPVMLGMLYLSVSVALFTTRGGFLRWADIEGGIAVRMCKIRIKDLVPGSLDTPTQATEGGDNNGSDTARRDTKA